MMRLKTCQILLNKTLQLKKVKVSVINGYSSSNSVLETVDLAYASYETAASEGEEIPPLIVLHGLMGSKGNWVSMSKAIQRTTGRKVVALDARNHGESPHSSEHSYALMAADVVAVMKKLNIPRATLLGHSMGGRTAMYLALSQPDLVTSLIVGDISPVRTSPNIYLMEGIFKAMSLVDIPVGVPMSQARKLADAQLASAIHEASLRSFIITNLVQNDSKEYVWRVNLDVLRKSFKRNIALMPEKIEGLHYQGPTLFLGGGKSDYIGRRDLPFMREFFPNANLTFIDDAGHWVHSEQPAIFHQLVCKFLVKYVL